MRSTILAAIIILNLTLCEHPDPVSEGSEYAIKEIWGEYGTEPGQFDRPLGLAVRRVPDPLWLSYFIADYGNGRVQVLPFTGPPPNGAVMIGQTPVDTSQAIQPVSVTVTQSIDDSLTPPENMRVYVTDARLHRICVFDLEGTFVRSWGGYGSDPGQFAAPKGIDMDFEGNIYVCDSGNHRVQVFDTVGNLVGIWGGYGTAPGLLRGPVDVEVAFDGTGRNFLYVAVTDQGNDRIQLFGRDGSLISAINGVARPAGLTIWEDEILVVSSSSNRVLAFDVSNPRSPQQMGSTDLPGATGVYDIFGKWGSNFDVTDSGGSRFVKYDYTASW